MPDASDALIGAGVVLVAAAVAVLASPAWALLVIGLFLVAVGVVKGRVG